MPTDYLTQGILKHSPNRATSLALLYLFKYQQFNFDVPRGPGFLCLSSLVFLNLPQPHFHLADCFCFMSSEALFTSFFFEQNQFCKVCMCLSLCVCVCALAHPFMLLCVYVCACFPEDDVFMELLLSCLYVGSMTEFRVSGLLSYLVSPLILLLCGCIFH